jgi:hypothetical protein
MPYNPRLIDLFSYLGKRTILIGIIFIGISKWPNESSHTGRSIFYILVT